MSRASKPVAGHLNLPNHSKQLSLHLGSLETRKTAAQKFIFQISTLNSHSINERFSFNQFILGHGLMLLWFKDLMNATRKGLWRAPSNSPVQLSTEKPLSIATLKNPAQLELMENDSDEDEVQCYYFSKGEAACSTSDSHSVHGRLKSHNSLRELLGASEFILSAIRDGCKIPFSTTPPRFWSKNNRSCLDNCDFVTEAILEFILKIKFQKSIPKNYTILIFCRYVFNLAAREKGSSLGDQSRSLQI